MFLSRRLFRFSKEANNKSELLFSIDLKEWKKDRVKITLLRTQVICTQLDVLKASKQIRRKQISVVQIIWVFSICCHLLENSCILLNSCRRQKQKKAEAQKEISTYNVIPTKNTRLIMLTKDLDKSLAIKVEESWIDSNRITRGGILGSGLFF